MPSSNPEETIILPIVVDSPPGTMTPDRPSRSSTALTSTGSTPRPRRISACSLKSPCSARTPIRAGESSSGKAPLVSPLPATGREPLPFRKVPHLPADHRLAEPPARLGYDLRVLVMGGRLHDGPRTNCRVAALEDAAAYENTVGAELHHERGVGRGCETTGREQHDRKATVLRDPPHQLVGSAKVLGLRHKLLRVEHAEATDPADDGAHVAHGLDHVAGAGLTLGPDHGRSLADPPEGLSQVRGPAHEGHLEDGLVYVMTLVGRRKNFGLI